MQRSSTPTEGNRKGEGRKQREAVPKPKTCDTRAYGAALGATVLCLLYKAPRIGAGPDFPVKHVRSRLGV